MSGFAWTDTDLPRDSHDYNLVMSCRVPRGFKLGTIQRAEREPAGGWTTD